MGDSVMSVVANNEDDGLLIGEVVCGTELFVSVIPGMCEVVLAVVRLGGEPLLVFMELAPRDSPELAKELDAEARLDAEAERTPFNELELVLIAEIEYREIVLPVTTVVGVP